jgi:hypothetical protein
MQDDDLADRDFIEAMAEEDFEASYEALFDDHGDGAPRHQLLGLPRPE